MVFFLYEGLTLLKNLELSDTEVGSNGLRHLSGEDPAHSWLFLLFECYIFTQGL